MKWSNSAGIQHMRVAIRLAGILVCFALLTACGDPPPVTSVITAPIVIPPGGSLTDFVIQVPQGLTLAFVAQPMNGNETLKQDISLASDDDTIARAFDTPEMNHFAVVGVNTGLTILRIIDDSGETTSSILSVHVTTP